MPTGDKLFDAAWQSIVQMVATASEADLTETINFCDVAEFSGDQCDELAALRKLLFGLCLDERRERPTGDTR